MQLCEKHQKLFLNLASHQSMWLVAHC